MASKLTPKLKKQIEQTLRNRHEWNQYWAKEEYKLLKKGSYRGHPYVVLEGPIPQIAQKRPYVGMILGGGYAEEGLGYVSSFMNSETAEYVAKIRLDEHPTAREYKAAGKGPSDLTPKWWDKASHISHKDRHSLDDQNPFSKKAERRNPANQQNLVLGALAAFAGYKMYKG